MPFKHQLRLSVVTSLKFTITPDRTFSDRPRVTQSCFTCPESEIRATFGSLFTREGRPSDTSLFSWDRTELSVLILKSEPALAVSTSCVGNFLPVSLQSSIKSEPCCFILGTLHQCKKTKHCEWLTDEPCYRKNTAFLPVNGAIAFACLAEAMSQLKLLTTPWFKPKHTQGSADVAQGHYLPPTQPGRRQQRQAETQRWNKGPVALLWHQTLSSGGRSRQEDWLTHKAAFIANFSAGYITLDAKMCCNGSNPTEAPPTLVRRHWVVF